jgi:hypothetical protein
MMALILSETSGNLGGGVEGDLTARRMQKDGSSAVLGGIERVRRRVV